MGTLNIVKNQIFRIMPDLSQEEYEALKKKVNEALAGAAKSLAKREVKLMRPPPSVKVLYTPSDSDIIMGRIGEAVERALARKTGRLS